MNEIVMFTNFLNHHQLPFCNAMHKDTNGHFYFVTQKAIATKRIGTYKIMDEDYPFLLKAYESDENHQKAFRLAEEADYVIIGSADEEYVRRRMEKKGITLRYSEHLYKEKGNIHEYFRNTGIIVLRHGRYRGMPVYLLCSSAYSAYDFNHLGVYRGKAYKYGYFPENHKYDIDALTTLKKKNSILWAGRLIKWKHPDLLLNAAKKLKEAGYSFSIRIIGQGEMKEALDRFVIDNGLQNAVELLGPMSPEEVRKYMEESSVFAFTSDRNEGWGAVLNEAMNSGCACVASHEAGSSGFLIRHKVNGMIYNCNDPDDFYNKLKYLLDNPECCADLGKKAYETIDKLWNADVAAERLIELCACIKEGKETPYSDGPCSKAKPVSYRNMYQYLIDGKSL